MAPDVCGGLRNSGSPGNSGQVLKKGPWTTAEDMLLLEYVKKHGEGNWNAVQRNSGLMRCGKSCRLRWANHLRPNLKKGSFTPDEEKLIVELHAQLGNKWARMASQLPGRTDNEIKNYWNTRLKRRQRAGLPIYPHELGLQEQHLQLNSSSSSQAPSLSSFLASANTQNPNPFRFSPPMMSPQARQPNTPYINHQLSFYRHNNGSLALSLDASNSFFSSSTLPAPPFFNQGLINQLSVSPLTEYNSLSHGISTGPEIDVLGLPSIQSPVVGTVTPAASSSEFLMATASSDGAEDYEVELGFGRSNKSGLLEDLFGESQALVRQGKPEEAIVAPGGSVHEEEAAAFRYGHGVANSGDNYEDPEARASRESIAAMDDDLMNLLDNFPLSVPIPDWNGGDGNESPILTNGTSRVIEGQAGALEYNPVATSPKAANPDRNHASCLWNNMPSIY